VERQVSDDAASDRITKTIAEAISAGELGDTTVGMPGGWVLVGTYHDDEGELRTVLLTNNGARTHETLGLLALGQTAWQEAARRWIVGPDRY
jgi:hypothetical protein